MTALIDKTKLHQYETLKKKLFITYLFIFGILLVLMTSFFVLSNSTNKSIYLIVNIVLMLILSFISIYYFRSFNLHLKQMISFLSKVKRDEYDVSNVLLINNLGYFFKDNMDLFGFTASVPFQNTTIEKTFYTIEKSLPIEQNTKIRIRHINNIIIAYEVLYENIQ